METIKFTFEEFEIRCKEIAKEILEHKEIKEVFGIPRGGLIPAIRISHLTGLPLIHKLADPKTTVIIDDCIDSGKTHKKYSEFDYYFVLINKQKKNISDWIEFFWEEKEC